MGGWAGGAGGLAFSVKTRKALEQIHSQTSRLIVLFESFPHQRRQCFERIVRLRPFLGVPLTPARLALLPGFGAGIASEVEAWFARGGRSPPRTIDRRTAEGSIK